MALVEIDDVVTLPDASDHLAGSSVEVPVIGCTRDVWSIPLSGWIVGRHEPVTTIEVIHQQVQARSAPVDLERADVAWAFPDIHHAKTSGFSLRIGGAWLPETFVLRLEAGFANGHRVPFALVRGRRVAVRGRHEPSLHPIAVTSLGRSGSTLMMRLLAAHPQAIVHGGHPYASRPSAYWMHMLRVLSDPADPIHSANPDGDDENLPWIGSAPLNGTDVEEVEQWFGRDYVEELAGFCQTSIDQFYGRLSQAQGLEQPLFFAEKHEPGYISRLLSGLYPGGREILLVRDFRDMACSMLDFYRKRGHISYGRDQVASDEEFLVSLAPAAARLVSYLHERSDSAYVLRYEDLAVEPHERLAEVLSYLGLDAGEELLQAMVDEATAETPELDVHRTAGDVAASIGRHREELSSHLVQVADDAFGPALSAFGYDRAAADTDDGRRVPTATR